MQATTLLHAHLTQLQQLLKRQPVVTQATRAQMLRHRLRWHFEGAALPDAAQTTDALLEVFRSSVQPHKLMPSNVDYTWVRHAWDELERLLLPGSAPTEPEEVEDSQNKTDMAHEKRHEQLVCAAAAARREDEEALRTGGDNRTGESAASSAMAAPSRSTRPAQPWKKLRLTLGHAQNKQQRLTMVVPVQDNMAQVQLTVTLETNQSGVADTVSEEEEAVTEGRMVVHAFSDRAQRNLYQIGNMRPTRLAQEGNAPGPEQAGTEALEPEVEPAAASGGATERASTNSRRRRRVNYICQHEGRASHWTNATTTAPTKSESGSGCRLCPEPYYHTSELAKFCHVPYYRTHNLQAYYHTDELAEFLHEPYYHTHERRHRVEPYYHTSELAEFRDEPYYIASDLQAKVCHEPDYHTNELARLCREPYYHANNIRLRGRGWTANGDAGERGDVWSSPTTAPSMSPTTIPATCQPSSATSPTTAPTSWPRPVMHPAATLRGGRLGLAGVQH